MSANDLDEEDEDEDSEDEDEDSEDEDEDEGEDSEDCPRCQGSGGGPEHWACPDCGGSGRNLALARQRREDYEVDRWDAKEDR